MQTAMINHFKILLYLSKVNGEKARKLLCGVRKYWSDGRLEDWGGGTVGLLDCLTV